MLEGSNFKATIKVLRDVNIFSGPMVLEYATSDLSAKGIDSYKFAECEQLSAAKRESAGCGDYLQSTGIISFAEGSNSGGFDVFIMNDNCLQRYFRYVQVFSPLYYYTKYNNIKKFSRFSRMTIADPFCSWIIGTARRNRFCKN